MGYNRNTYERIRKNSHSERMHTNSNYVFCVGAGRSKLLFESEAKARTFMKFNSEKIADKNGHAPVRAYYCECCGGWHLTSTERYHADMDFEKNAILENYRVERESREQSIRQRQTFLKERAAERKKAKGAWR